MKDIIKPVFFMQAHRRSHSLRSDTWNGSFGPKECQISAKLSGATMGSMSLHHGTSKPSTTRVWMERAGAQSCTARCLAWLPWPDVTKVLRRGSAALPEAEIAELWTHSLFKISVLLGQLQQAGREGALGCDSKQRRPAIHESMC